MVLYSDSKLLATTRRSGSINDVGRRPEAGRKLLRQRMERGQGKGGESGDTSSKLAEWWAEKTSADFVSDLEVGCGGGVGVCCR